MSTARITIDRNTTRTCSLDIRLAISSNVQYTLRRQGDESITMVFLRKTQIVKYGVTPEMIKQVHRANRGNIKTKSGWVLGTCRSIGNGVVRAHPGVIGFEVEGDTPPPFDVLVGQFLYGEPVVIIPIVGMRKKVKKIQGPRLKTKTIIVTGQNLKAREVS